MELRNVFNIDLIGGNNTAHVRNIVAENRSLFYETIMSINKDDYLKF